MQDAFTGRPTCIQAAVLPGEAGRAALQDDHGDDWKRSLDLARLQQNAVSEQIRTVISSSSKKTR